MLCSQPLGSRKHFIEGEYFGQQQILAAKTAVLFVRHNSVKESVTVVKSMGLPMVARLGGGTRTGPRLEQSAEVDLLASGGGGWRMGERMGGSLWSEWVNH